MTSRPNRRRVLRNLVRSVAGVSFPLAGSVVVIYTLSGDTRKVAIVATAFAIVGHITHSMMELSDGRRDRADSDIVVHTRMMD